MPCPFRSRHVISPHVASRHVVSPLPVACSRPARSCHVALCDVTSDITVVPRLWTGHLLPAPWCHVSRIGSCRLSLCCGMSCDLLMFCGVSLFLSCVVFPNAYRTVLVFEWGRSMWSAHTAGQEAPYPSLASPSSWSPESLAQALVSSQHSPHTEPSGCQLGSCHGRLCRSDPTRAVPAWVA